MDFAVNGSSGFDGGTIEKDVNIHFSSLNNTIKLLLFTSDPSIIQIYDETVKNYRLIGDGEKAFEYHVGGYSFLNKWMERNI